jgi:hypothetical protein
MTQRDRPESRSGAPLIEVTPEMIEAGVFEAREHCLGAPIGDLVRSVYIAMALEVREKDHQPQRQGASGTG